jgi:transcription elongation GreA/GreB family factor
MENAPTYAEVESLFFELIVKRPLPVATMLPLIHSSAVLEDGKKADEWTGMLMQELLEAADFQGLYLVIRDCAQSLTAQLKLTSIRDMLKKAAIKDRLATALIDTAGFGTVPLEESFRRLDLLLALVPGTLVIDANWGVGTVKRLDDFYKRITIDFIGKPSHTLTFDTACDSIVRAPHDHVMTLRHNDPEGIKKMVAEKQGELVCLALRSFGNMTIVRLEDVLVKNGFVAPEKWKSFWESARKTLKSNPLVNIPQKRTDMIELRTEVESYGDAWFARIASMKDPVKILEAISEFEDTGKLLGLDDVYRGILEDRLAFAIKGAHNTDPALYARLAVTINRLGCLNPPIDQLRCHLWGNDRYITASEQLSVRDVNEMTQFLLADGIAANTRFLNSLSAHPFNLLNDVLTTLKDTPEAATACANILSQSKVPPTVINWILRFRESVPTWTLPPLIDLLAQAISIIESKLSGESLRMQNNIKQYIELKLDDLFEKELSLTQRQYLFERIQASSAWDSTTHRTLLGRMLKIEPSLSDRKKIIQQQPQSSIRQTSWRSISEKQALYKRLIEVDLPKNSNDIAVARSYGDLRENFEYQAAKDYQRQLLQRQSELQLELKQVKGTDFSGLPYDKAGQGTTVVIRAEAGDERTYTILGEWDRDENLNIISCRTRMAMALEGKRAGDTATIPVVGGEASATVIAVNPLSDTIRQWINTPPEELEAR